MRWAPASYRPLAPPVLRGPIARAIGFNPTPPIADIQPTDATGLDEVAAELGKWYLYDTAENAVRFMLPPADREGAAIMATHVGTSNNPITIIPDGNDLVQGATSFAISGERTSATIRVARARTSDAPGQWVIT